MSTSIGDDRFRIHRGRYVWGPFTSFAQESLDLLEVELGGPLPEQYLTFVTAHHGGTVEYSVRLPPGEHGEPICFSDWFTLAPVNGAYSWGSVLGEWRLFKESHQSNELPGDLLPIARDGGGSTLYLRLGPDHRGEVWAFVHGLPAWAGGTMTDSFGSVAHSFEEYFDSLFVDEDLAEIEWMDRTPEYEDVIAAWLDSGFPGWRTRPWANQQQENGAI